MGAAVFSCAVARAGEIGGDADLALKQLVASRIAALSTCKPPDARVISIGFLVHADGKVSEVSSQPGAAVEGMQCVQAAVARWTFPATKGDARNLNLIVGWGLGVLRLVQLDVGKADDGNTTSEPRGGLPKEVVQRVFRAHAGAIQRCYERALVKKPELAGKLMTQLTIARSGVVTGAVIMESTLGDPIAERCITDEIRTWKFPQPSGGGMVVVRYPFVFKTAE